jgi:hypothetical protein
LLRYESLAFIPLHSNQHAYQAEKSVEMGLHQLVFRGEKALDQQEPALDVFLDIEGAFNNTSYDSIYATLAKHGVGLRSYDALELPWRVGWLQQLLEDFPGVLEWTEAAHREASCHCSYGALRNYGCQN